jgi:hypothetical protein
MCHVPLTPEQASHRMHLDLTFRDRRVVRADHRSGEGGVGQDETGDTGFEVTYDGPTLSLRWFDRWG